MFARRRGTDRRARRGLPHVTVIAGGIAAFSYPADLRRAGCAQVCGTRSETRRAIRQLTARRNRPVTARGPALAENSKPKQFEIAKTLNRALKTPSRACKEAVVSCLPHVRPISIGQTTSRRKGNEVKASSKRRPRGGSADPVGHDAAGVRAQNWEYVSPSIRRRAGQRAPALTSANVIKHVVVIFQENVSFDHYFATYPVAAKPSRRVDLCRRDPGHPTSMV